MKKTYLIIIAIFQFFAYSDFLNAADFSVRARVDSIAMFIGDQATLSFDVEQSSGVVVSLPALTSDVLGKLEIVEILKPDTTVLDGILNITHSYKLTSFDSTLALIPSLPFVGSGDTQYSNPVSFKVVEVPVDTTQMAITDIKAIQDPGFDYYLMYSIIAGVLIFIALLFAAYYLFKLYKKKTVVDSEPIFVDPRSAFEIANDSLNILKDKKLYQQGKVKDYFTELTDILRIFIFNKYKINALESTSDELLFELRQIDVIKNDKEYLMLAKDILSMSDLVKFAKYSPEDRECDFVFGKVENLIQLDNTITVIEENNEDIK